MNSLLLKRAFKSLFKNKLFIGLMILLVFVTSLTFTVFESTSSGFKTSYNQLVNNNALHDVVIKENFQIAESDKLDDSNANDIKLLDKDGKVVDVNEQNISSVISNSDVLTFVVAKDYSKYNLSIRDKSIQIDASDWLGATDKSAKIAEYKKQVKSLFENVLKKRLSNSFVTQVADIYKDELVINEMNSISVSAGVSAYKVVKYNEDTEVNKMNIYDGTSKFTKPLTEDQMLAELNDQINNAKSLDPNVVYSQPNTLKGYKITAQDNVSRVLSVSDISAYEAIISTTYANANDKHSISLKQFTKLSQKLFPSADGTVRNFFDALSEDKSLQDEYKNNLIWVDKTPYFIIGIGQTPDFAYPIIDEKHPTIDKNNQSIVYVNSRGYERIEDGFRSNPRENYISVKFLKGITASRQTQIMDELEVLCKDGKATIHNQTVEAPRNSFGPSVKMVTRFDDPNDQMILTQERVAFLQKLEGTINTVSFATTLLLIVFVGVIVAMVFGVLVSSSRKSLATLLALGYTKFQIAASTAFISLLIGAVPALIGYLAGFGTQYALINAFDNYWTIPTYGHSFSWVSLVATAVLPTVPLFVLIFGITYMTLNYPIPSMLNDAVRDNSWVIARIMSPFKFIGIKTKYSISLVLRNSGKVLLVSLTTVIASVALMVGISTVGQGNEAYASTVAATNYEYKVDLYSPTAEGGEYQVVKYDDGIYKDESGNEIQHSKTVYDKLASDQQALQDLRNQPYWHMPVPAEQTIALPESISSQPTTTEIEQVVHYLKNKIQTKALLDKSISGIDPWGTAKQLMPDNQINTANQNWEDLKSLASKYGLPLNNDADFFNLIKNPQVASAIKPYLITYDLVPTDSDDEMYTYIDSTMNINGQVINMNVAGIRPDSSMFNLESSDVDKLVSNENSTFVPVLVNKFSMEFYKLSVGSTFEATVNNDVDRNFKNHQDHKVTYKVLGQIAGYNDAPFITLQSIANKTIDAHNLMNQSELFNGVLSKNNDSTLLSSLPLYSPSGIYFATDTLTETSNFGQWLSYALKDPNIWKYANEIASNASEFIAKYSQTPLNALINKVEWKEMDGKTFASVSSLSSALINTIEGVSIILSILFTIIVIGLIIRTNKKKIATLWTMGYRKNEVARMFLTSVLLPAALSLIIASPISMVIIYGLREFIMHFGHVLIPFTLAAWIPFAVIGLIAFVYWAITVIFIWRMSSQSALEAFKGD